MENNKFKTIHVKKKSFSKLYSSRKDCWLSLSSIHLYVTAKYHKDEFVQYIMLLPTNKTLTYSTSPGCLIIEPFKAVTAWRGRASRNLEFN